MATRMANAYEIIAADAGEIVIEVQGNIIPCKSVRADRKIDITPEHGTGSHLPYNLTEGKITYEGTFRIGSFTTSAPGDAAVWEELLQVYLEDPSDEGLPRKFNIRIVDRKSGGQIQSYKGCKLSGDSIDIGEPGKTTEREYPFSALRRVIGNDDESPGGGALSGESSPPVL